MYQIDTIESITIEATNFCNAKCPQCSRYNKYGEIQKSLPLIHLDPNCLQKIPFEKMTSLDTIKFNGNYGDPLMHPQIDKILDIFKNYKLVLSTNASLRSANWWKNLAKYKIKVKFAVDGLEDTHSLYRRNTDYKKIMDNAKAFINAGGNAEWQYIIFKHNEHQVDEAKLLSEKLGFKGIVFQYSDRFLATNKTPVYENKKIAYYLESATKQKTMHELSGAKEGTFYTKNFLNNENMTSEIQCPWAEAKRLQISADSLVFPCCYMLNVLVNKPIHKSLWEKIIKSYSGVNLNYHTFEDILTSEIFQKLIPASLKNKPHITCIEHCANNFSKGKLFDQEQTVLNSAYD
jgi:sulfatase maturation enzyme AslB (radical SAM superfamily)